MLVVTLTDCPPALRGDLTRWLQEINTGVYVGNVSARVRERLWKRIQETAKNGRVTMVFNAKNEQRLDFRTHNNTWEAIDFDGLKLMLRPSPARAERRAALRQGYSSAAQMHKAKGFQRAQTKPKPKEEPKSAGYVVLDLETTGLSDAEHEIIEIGAIKVTPGKPDEIFHALV
ncbi:MAG: type I-E CRISPR-associated endoribonuclease Cas2e, partial [Oscillospiraceae bacterium]|nr:type I-E CRISPR-associated endoribonuclease Cas2e [Oscillospiraceae bacterium]